MSKSGGRELYSCHLLGYWMSRYWQSYHSPHCLLYDLNLLFCQAVEFVDELVDLVDHVGVQVTTPAHPRQSTLIRVGLSKCIFQCLLKVRLIDIIQEDLAFFDRNLMLQQELDESIAVNQGNRCCSRI